MNIHFNKKGGNIMKYVVRPKKSSLITMMCDARCSGNCFAKCGALSVRRVN